MAKENIEHYKMLIRAKQSTIRGAKKEVERLKDAYKESGYKLVKLGITKQSNYVKKLESELVVLQNKLKVEKIPDFMKI